MTSHRFEDIEAFYPPAKPKPPQGAPRQIDRYTVQRPLGSGGAGTVYLALDPETGEQVAIKLLLEEQTPSEETRRRFLREIRYLQGLSHPHCVRYLDQGLSQHGIYLVLEHCAGGSLRALVEAEGPLAPELAAAFVLDALSGLTFLHKQGLVHRDVKPANLLLTQRGGGRVKVADFGLAKRLVGSISSKLTSMGRRGMGTPQYVAPEQQRDAHSARATADVWSAAATLHYLLTARPPREARGFKDSAVSTAAAPVEEVHPVPAELRDVLARGLHEDPAQRFPTAAAFRKVLAGLTG